MPAQRFRQARAKLESNQPVVGDSSRLVTSQVTSDFQRVCNYRWERRLVECDSGFRNRRIQPLCHLSKRNSGVYRHARPSSKQLPIPASLPRFTPLHLPPPPPTIPAMARLRDVPTVLRSFGTWAFVRRIIQQINEDGLCIWASALAYSWLFAIFPFLDLSCSLSSRICRNARASPPKKLSPISPRSLSAKPPTINDNVLHVTRLSRSRLARHRSLVTLWAASGGMSMTMSALGPVLRHQARPAVLQTPPCRHSSDHRRDRHGTGGYDSPPRRDSHRTFPATTICSQPTLTFAI